MTSTLLWIIAKLLVILIHCTYTHENIYNRYGERLDNIDDMLTNIKVELNGQK